MSVVLLVLPVFFKHVREGQWKTRWSWKVGWNANITDIEHEHKDCKHFRWGLLIHLYNYVFNLREYFCINMWFIAFFQLFCSFTLRWVSDVFKPGPLCLHGYKRIIFTTVLYWEPNCITNLFMLQQPQPKWSVTSPAGPATGLAGGNSCRRTSTLFSAPTWCMPSPSSTTRLRSLNTSPMRKVSTNPLRSWRKGRMWSFCMCVALFCWTALHFVLLMSCLWWSRNPTLKTLLSVREASEESQWAKFHSSLLISLFNSIFEVCFCVWKMHQKTFLLWRLPALAAGKSDDDDSFPSCAGSLPWRRLQAAVTPSSSPPSGSWGLMDLTVWIWTWTGELMFFHICSCAR